MILLFLNLTFQVLLFFDSFRSFLSYVWDTFHLESETVSRICLDCIEFSHCLSLKTITMENLMRIQGTNTFEHCISLERVNINHIIRIGDNAFLGCIKLVNILLNSLTTLPSSCFRDCISLRTAFLEDVNYFEGDNHFYNCTNLEYVSLPSLKTVSINSTNIFYNCNNIQVIVLASTPPIKFDNNIFQNKNLSICLPNEDDYENYQNNCSDVNLCNDELWLGINIEVDNDLKDKCDGYTKFNEFDKLMYFVYIGVPFVVIIIVALVIVFVLYRNKKKEKEDIENVPHLSVNIIDSVI